MKTLAPITFDHGLCSNEFGEFRSWLSAKSHLGERKDVLRFFRPRQQLATLFGVFNSGIARVDRLAWEFDIFGDFACDLVVGDSEGQQYCFVEFEGATKKSIFEKKGNKATREWGRMFEHGYSQIIDWIHKLSGTSRDDLLKRFGSYEIRYETALVIGRDADLDASEKQRLAWRADNVSVNVKKVTCITYDDLLRQLSVRLTALSPSPVNPPQGKPSS
jgi:hypothetical protein